MPQFLLHIGAARAASTFLQGWFLAHPQLRYVVRGIAGLGATIDVGALAEQSLCGNDIRYLVTSEEGFSGTWLPRETGRPPDAAHKMWATPWTRSKGSASESYRVYAGAARDILRAKCQWLKHLFPTSHVLYITRGFEASLRSYYMLFAQLGIWDKPRDIMGFLHASPELGAMLDFDLVIELYVEQFGGEKVHVLPYELLRDNPAEFLGALEAEFELDPYPFAPRRVNASLTARELYWHVTLASWADRLERVTGMPIRRRCQAYFASAPRSTRLVRRLARASERRISLDIDSQYLQQFQSRAVSLQKNPRYARFAREYLWEFSGGLAQSGAAPFAGNS